MKEYTYKDEPGSKQTIIIHQYRSNGLGTAGFALSLIALLLCWMPVVDWIIWLLGFIFSFLGIFKRPRGLAIAGLVLSLIGVFTMIFVIGALALIATVL